MLEKDMQSLFTKWLKENCKRNGAYELKICKKKSMPFSAVQEHQVNALWKAKHSCLVHKISDMSLGAKPMDCFSLSRAKAFVVILFYVPREPKECFLIDIDDFIKCMETSKRKSLTYEMADEIAEEIINL